MVPEMRAQEQELSYFSPWQLLVSGNCGGGVVTNAMVFLIGSEDDVR